MHVKSVSNKFSFIGGMTTVFSNTSDFPHYDQIPLSRHSLATIRIFEDPDTSLDVSLKSVMSGRNPDYPVGLTSGPSVKERTHHRRIRKRMELYILQKQFVSTSSTGISWTIRAREIILGRGAISTAIAIK
ncbi:hypothetical protein AVEN_265628-1 [Araneus ventricosus]|uniref:Uncharacterized protein n=1 Tax=Araneus ventricosus TaxID=182803 RepID=A0A4Y2GHE0_ARAVE|nr:hypothetical protein AVEN_265628-1 [Araneus ventricosus]